MQQQKWIVIAFTMCSIRLTQSQFGVPMFAVPAPIHVIHFAIPLSQQAAKSSSSTTTTTTEKTVHLVPVPVAVPVPVPGPPVPVPVAPQGPLPAPMHLPLPPPVAVPIPMPMRPPVVVVPYRPMPRYRPPRPGKADSDFDWSDSDDSSSSSSEVSSSETKRRRRRKRKRDMAKYSMKQWKKRNRVQRGDYRRDIDFSDNEVRPELSYLNRDGVVKLKRVITNNEADELLNDNETTDSESDQGTQEGKPYALVVSADEDVVPSRRKNVALRRGTTTRYLSKGKKELIFRPPGEKKITNLSVSFQVV